MKKKQQSPLLVQYAMEWLLQFAVPAGGGAAALACGFVIGWLICFTGVGGGVLVIPALTFFFELPVSVAIGTASAYATMTKIMAGAEHVRIKNVNYRLFAKLACFALPGLLLSAAAVNTLLHHLPHSADAVQQTLRAAVIGAILLSLLLILRGGGARTAAGTPALAAAATVIGVVMGCTGIGGGVLIAPALMLLGRESPKRIVGTSILTALALSLVTAALYTAGGQLDFSLAVWMSAGSLAAVPIASRTLRRVSEAVVQKTLLALIATAVVLMLAGNG